MTRLLWYNRGKARERTALTVTPSRNKVRLVTMSRTSDSTTAGVYVITCTANGKNYVGSSVDINERWVVHTTLLNKNKHHNRHLQFAWNKHGSDAFTIAVLEECNPAKLLEREQHYLDTMQPFGETGFNLSRKAGAPMAGLKHTPEAREKIKAALLGRHVSPKTRAKLSESQKGKSRPPSFGTTVSRALKGRKLSPEHNRNKSLGQKKYYIVISPGGVETLIRGIMDFCREHNLRYNKMIEVAQGKRKHHMGWRCRYA